MKKVALISTYCDTQEKLDVLEKNINNVKTCGLDVIVISPIFLPENIQKKCDYFFLMKDNVNPIWEDENNINGGCWSFKIHSSQSQDLWDDLSTYLVTENLSLKANYITGLSICLKKII